MVESIQRIVAGIFCGFMVVVLGTLVYLVAS